MATCSQCNALLPPENSSGICPRCIARGCARLFDEEESSIAFAGMPPLRESLEVGELLGAGGMGEVFAARDAVLNRTVALKQLRVERTDDSHFIARFENEARVVALLEHPNIVPLYEAGRAPDGRPFYTMRRVDGVTLTEVLQRLAIHDAEWLARYPLATLLTIFQKICDAVAFAHSRGVIHRDLKPDNIMLGSFGEVLVMDWGLARTAGTSEEATATPAHTSSPALTLDGAVIGTPSFMAPEQAHGRVSEQDERTDIFALGGILYAMLTLRGPVEADTVEEALNKTRRGEIVLPSKLKSAANPHCPGGRIPESLAAVAMKALSLRPEDRYESVTALQRDVTAYQNGFATSAEDASVWRHLGLLVRRHRIAALTTAGVLVLVALFMAKIVASERKANATLARLRATIPLQRAEIDGLIREHKFEAALPKIAYLNSLSPDNAEFHALRGNVNQSLLRFGDAAAAFEEALRLDKNFPRAQENLALSRRLASEHGTNKLRDQTILEIRDALSAQQRFAEAVAMERQIQTNRDRLVLEWKLRLRERGLPAKRADTLMMRPDGLFELNASGPGISNLTFVQGLPLASLMLDQTSVSDLSPLRDTPLRELVSRNGAAFGDLSPLQGLPLWHLAIHGAPVTDLRPLAGMKLKELDLIQLKTSDIAPLAGMPLWSLRLQIEGVTSIEPLRGMTNLSHLTLTSDLLEDISPLAAMPLRSVGLGGAKIRSIEVLRGKALTRFELTRAAVTGLGPLRGMKLETLNLDDTQVTDLNPLRGMPIQNMRLTSNLRCDLAPLASLPLVELWLSSTNVDFGALLNCKQLKRVALPMCKRIEVLRGHPTIQSFAIAWESDWGGGLPPAEFWRVFDERKRAGKLTE